MLVRHYVVFTRSHYFICDIVFTNTAKNVDCRWNIPPPHVLIECILF
jgi:hypothetical protein